MKQHTGLVAILYKPGQPMSEALATVERNAPDLLVNFNTPVRNRATGDVGIASVWNLQSDAEDALLDADPDGECEHAIVSVHVPHDWGLLE